AWQRPPAPLRGLMRPRTREHHDRDRQFAGKPVTPIIIGDCARGAHLRQRQRKPALDPVRRALGWRNRCDVYLMASRTCHGYG
ncbi:MAG: hypothetical protein NZ823_01315, partial [Blastocatellia bacterium]|nr:hypothetical protein [Blastocatellia bacterium]